MHIHHNHKITITCFSLAKNLVDRIFKKVSLVGNGMRRVPGECSGIHLPRPWGEIRFGVEDELPAPGDPRPQYRTYEINLDAQHFYIHILNKSCKINFNGFNF